MSFFLPGVIKSFAMASSFEHTMSRRLQCPICLELLSDPKQLSCTHTFCKKCLSATLACSSQTTVNSLACPICRSITDVTDGNVDILKTNLPIRSLVDDVINGQHLCDMCHTHSGAVHSYCECGKNMCNTCLENHIDLQPNHRVVDVEDIKEGKLVLEKEVYCDSPEHTLERTKRVCTDVCITCKKFICERCRLIDHKDHTVQSAEGYKASTKTEIESLQTRGKTKAKTIQEHQVCIESQKKRLTDHIDGKRAEIYTIYEESIKKLNERKDALDRQLETQKVKLCKRLDEMKDADEKWVTSIESASVLAVNSLKAPLEDDTIVIRDSLSGILKNVLGRDDPKKKLATHVADRAEQLIFTPNKHRDQLNIGEVHFKKYGFITILFWISIVTISLSALHMYYHQSQAGHWINKYDVELSQKDRMNAMAPTPDGRMAVAYNTGGIDIFSAEGKRQQTVPMDVSIIVVAFLSTGRNVVLGYSNNITLYTSEWQKLCMKFHTLSKDEGGFPSLTVDSNDLIYVSYRDANKIQVFSPAGGNAIREIPCNGYKPQQITSYRDLLIIEYIDTIMTIDKKGNVKHTVQKSGFTAFAAVTQNNSILIAWLNNNDALVSIDEYTNELKHVKTLISDQKIEKPERKWYYIQEFQSGEIAFCTPDRLYIFKPINV